MSAIEYLVELVTDSIDRAFRNSCVGVYIRFQHRRNGNALCFLFAVVSLTVSSVYHIALYADRCVFVRAYARI